MKRIYLVFILLLTFNILSAQKWDETFGLTYQDESLQDIIESYDKGYLISGSYELSYWSNWLIKTDINGDMLWEKKISHDSYDLGMGAINQNSNRRNCHCQINKFSKWRSVAPCY